MATNGPSDPPPPYPAAIKPEPEWAPGLRQLYASVLDEPLPDALQDLLDRLDTMDSGEAP